MNNVAIILAAGSGSRFSADLPKQLAKLAGKTVLEHTLDVFQKSTFIDEIIIVAKEDNILLTEDLVLRGKYNKVSRVLKGGTERYLSTYAGISSLADDRDNVLIHDAARPLVSDRILQRCVEALSRVNAVDVVVQTADTIVQVSNDIIESIPPRKSLRRGQTPQAFKLGTIKEAYRLAFADPQFINAPITDDCGVVLKYMPHEPIHIVPGEEDNIKITHSQDIFLADKLFQLRTIRAADFHTDEFYKSNLQGKVLVVFGGSYGIGEDIVRLASSFGAKVFSFSRSSTNTHVESISDVEGALSLVLKEVGKIDYVVNTAAILCKQPLEHMSNSSILNQLNVNYLGMINVAKASVSYLEKTQGHLLLFTSSSYTLGRANYSLYSSSKAAAVNFTQALAEEWQHKGVKVNCICPERTKTPMRLQNFGIEPDDTLLSPVKVAQISINVLLDDYTGRVVKVGKDD